MSQFKATVTKELVTLEQTLISNQGLIEEKDLEQLALGSALTRDLMSFSYSKENEYRLCINHTLKFMGSAYRLLDWVDDAVNGHIWLFKKV